MTDTTETRVARALADLESAAGFLRSAYFEAVVTKAVSGAVVASGSPWLDRAAAAAYARCSTSEIDRAAAAGVFRRYKRNGTPLFKRAELDGAIEEGRWQREL